jgi:hypothetical protein
LPSSSSSNIKLSIPRTCASERRDRGGGEVDVASFVALFFVVVDFGGNDTDDDDVFFVVVAEVFFFAAAAAALVVVVLFLVVVFFFLVPLLVPVEALTAAAAALDFFVEVDVDVFLAVVFFPSSFVALFFVVEVDTDLAAAAGEGVFVFFVRVFGPFLGFDVFVVVITVTFFLSGLVLFVAVDVGGAVFMTAADGGVVVEVVFVVVFFFFLRLVVVTDTSFATGTNAAVVAAVVDTGTDAVVVAAAVIAAAVVAAGTREEPRRLPRAPRPISPTLTNLIDETKTYSSPPVDCHLIKISESCSDVFLITYHLLLIQSDRKLLPYVRSCPVLYMQELPLLYSS